MVSVGVWVIFYVYYDRSWNNSATTMIHRNLHLSGCTGPSGTMRHLNHVLIVHLLTLWIIGVLSVKDSEYTNVSHALANHDNNPYAIPSTMKSHKYTKAMRVADQLVNIVQTITDYRLTKFQS